jgi:hypothetical protein
MISVLGVVMEMEILSVLKMQLANFLSRVNVQIALGLATMVPAHVEFAFVLPERQVIIVSKQLIVLEILFLLVNLLHILMYVVFVMELVLVA